jgi:hypothetical protein
MRCRYLLMIAGLTVSVTSCVMTPLADDISSLDTHDIAQSIRCETRDAIRAILANSIAKSDPVWAENLRRSPAGFVGLDRRQLAPTTREVVERYDQAVVIYDFKFDIKAQNRTGAGLGIGRLYSRGTFDLGLSASNNLERKTTDTFRLADRFEFLASEMREDVCGDLRRAQGPTRPHAVYPITGTIGMYRLVLAFFNLNQSSNLVGPAGSEDTPTKSTTIEFTTTVAGSVNPVLKLAAAGSSFKVTGASFLSDSSRTDMHQVTVVMQLPFDPEDGREKGTTILEHRTRLRNIDQANRTLEVIRQQRQQDELIDALRARTVFD